MKITLNILVKFILILLLSSNIIGKLYAGNFVGEQRDTSFIKEKYIVTIHVLQNEKEHELVDSLHNLNISNPKFPDRFIAGHDSVKTLLVSQMQIGMIKSRWSDDSYMESVICRNGLKLIFKDGIQFQKYYPKDDIVIMGWCDWIFNLATGEKDYDPEFTSYSQSRTFRIVSSVHADRSSYIEMQVYNSKQKKYLSLFDLSQLIGSNVDDRFWYGERLYLYANDNWCEIILNSK